MAIEPLFSLGDKYQRQETFILSPAPETNVDVNRLRRGDLLEVRVAGVAGQMQWSEVKWRHLNWLQRIVRWLGWGYRNTTDAAVAGIIGAFLEEARRRLALPRKAEQLLRALDPLIRHHERDWEVPLMQIRTLAGRRFRGAEYQVQVMARVLFEKADVDGSLWIGQCPPELAASPRKALWGFVGAVLDTAPDVTEDQARVRFEQYRGYAVRSFELERRFNAGEAEEAVMADVRQLIRDAVAELSCRMPEPPRD